MRASPTLLTQNPVEESKTVKKQSRTVTRSRKGATKSTKELIEQLVRKDMQAVKGMNAVCRKKCTGCLAWWWGA